MTPIGSHINMETPDHDRTGRSSGRPSHLNEAFPKEEFMGLRSKKDTSPEPTNGVLLSSFLSKPAPKYKFPEQQVPPAAPHQLVHDELLLDGNSRQNLATFCQTWVEPEVRRLMDECVDKNMIDKEEYPQTAEIEARCVHMLADLWNAPDGARTIGCSTTGSSEAAMLGGLALKWKWRERQQAAGRS